MKFSKVAAVVAGSMMAVGVAAPAFADDMAAPTMPTSVNGGVEQALAAQPLQKAADSSHVGSALDTVTQTTQKLTGETNADALLGQVTGAATGAGGPLGALGGGLPTSGLLGGLPLGG
ncbi:MAG TPA: hypothetical protein VGL02_14785 [Streptomyces sp.]